MVTEQTNKNIFLKSAAPHKGKGNGKNKDVQPPESLSEEQDDYFCLACFEPYSNRLPGEEWLKCSECRLWAHDACTHGGRFYTCQNCDSEPVGSGM